MKTTNIADLRSNLSHFLSRVEAGEEIEICKRNVPFARIVPLPVGAQNSTKLGCGLGTIVVETDLTEPAMTEDDWDMLKDG